MVEHPDAARPTASRRLYRPLDVASWSDSFKVAIGWHLVIWIAVVSGGLFALYEVKIINVGDTDLRAMQYDYRITSDATNYYHTYFVNGETCCNEDPVISEPDTCQTFAMPGPACPPIVYFECFHLADYYCNLTRATVYAALGMTPSGEYSDCMLGGKIRVGAIGMARRTKTSILAVDSDGTFIDTFSYDITQIEDPFIQQGIQAFVSGIAEAYGTTDFIQPNQILSKALLVDGRQASLGLAWVAGQGDRKTIGQWPYAIFTFPGMGKHCKKTGSGTQYFLSGYLSQFDLGDFDYTRPQDMVSTISFYNDSITFPRWQVELSDTSSLVQAPNLNYLTVRPISSIQISVGMIAALGPCYGWMIDHDPASIIVTYGNASYNGPASGLATANITGYPTTLYITVKDVSTPVKIALPPYSGMWYIVFAFLMAAFWTFGLGFFILIGIPLIWWNVRSNKGKPPLVYRYMRRYRGW